MKKQLLMSLAFVVLAIGSIKSAEKRKGPMPVEEVFGLVKAVELNLATKLNDIQKKLNAIDEKLNNLKK